MGKLTDNKLEQVKVFIDIADVDLHSYLLDLGLQKLEAAKIEFIEFIVDRVAKGLGEAAFDSNINIAVLNDPDDETTLNYPDNEFQHDVIGSFTAHARGVQNVVQVFQSSVPRIEFTEDEDVYALRNLRINSQCTTAAFGPAGEGEVLIGFRREAVKTSDFQNIIENL